MNASIVKPVQAPEFEEKLSGFRKEIDAIDDELFALLKKRIEIVNRVGSLKHAHKPDACVIRPGREGTMVQRVAEAFKNSKFLPAAAVVMWRMIIAASLHKEAPLKVAVQGEDATAPLFWLAREFFGPFTQLALHQTYSQVIAETLKDKQTVAVLPMPGEGEKWWMQVAFSDKEWPRIFARLPVMEPAKRPRIPVALALGQVIPEPTGDDTSFFALATDGEVSVAKLQDALTKEGLQAKWVATEQVADMRYHLIEIDGFISGDDSKIQTFQAASKPHVVRLVFMGACPKSIAFANGAQS